jgi:uncharacterized protein involved in exopolysaccharide biosynthesis
MEKGEMEEIKRHFGVVVEGLRTEIRQVAEGHQVIRNEIQELREQNAREHKEILSAIKFSYAELDQRLTTVEGEVTSLKSRMERLEAQRR